MKIIQTIQEHERNYELLTEYNKMSTLPPISHTSITIKDINDGKNSFSTNLTNCKNSNKDWLIRRHHIFHEALQQATNDYFEFLSNELNLKKE